MSHAHAHEAHAEEHIHHPNYTRVYFMLLGLLCISVVGPMFGVKILTLITAFGVAVVKAYLVAKNFMHINLAQRYVTYLVTTGLVFMLLFFAGTAPDVMKKEGTNWEKPSWLAAAAAYAEGHGAGGHGGQAGH
jgi:caa(3)-type oxidase subunit IV